MKAGHEVGLVCVCLMFCGCKSPSSEASYNLERATKNELQLPPEVTSDTTSWEIARIWKTKNGQTVIIQPPKDWGGAEWGIMLSDMAGHVANAKRLTGGERKKFLHDVRTWLDEELDHPTDQPTGHF